jgi:hypothetical protein
MVTEGPSDTAYHFGPEVLVVLPHERFPWAVWSTEAWATYADLEELAAL